MKCIYCNSEAELTVSDIIPWALTGAKVQKKFVCRTHNAFTNDNYEKKLISELDIFRNLLGLQERDGDPVRFSADLEIGKYTVKNINVSDKASLLGTSRVFSTMENGKKVVIGDIERLKKIKGAESKITTINASDIAVSKKSDLREMFISNESLHAVAKIAYEWFCYQHSIEEYRPEFTELVEYILDPCKPNTVVQIVTDDSLQQVVDLYSRTGSNMLFEYAVDGNNYVIFSLWNVILYKISISKQKDAKDCEIAQLHKLFFYHVDGKKEEITIGTCGAKFDIESKEPDIALSMLVERIKDALSQLGNRDLSKEYIEAQIKAIKAVIPLYSSGEKDIAELLNYEENDRVVTIYILEMLYNNQDKIDHGITVTEAIHRVFSEGVVIMNHAQHTELVKKYNEMHLVGTLGEMIKNSIQCYEDHFSEKS